MYQSLFLLASTCGKICPDAVSAVRIVWHNGESAVMFETLSGSSRFAPTVAARSVADQRTLLCGHAAGVPGVLA